MAEQRQKSLTILLHDGRKTVHTVELFPAEQWPEQDGRPGMFRVRLDRKWDTSDGSKYAFWDIAGIGWRLGQLLVPTLGNGPVGKHPCPVPPVGAAVRVTIPGRQYTQIGRVISGLLIGEDNSWQVLVSFQSRELVYRGRQLIPVDRLEVV